MNMSNRHRHLVERQRVTAEIAEAVSTWTSAMADHAAQMERAAVRFAEWGLPETALHFQREADMARQELAEGFFGG